MSPKNVNELQLTILRRIADGVEPVTSHEHHLATTVYALRNRGLVATMRTGSTWTVSITDDGRYFLSHGHYRADAAATVTERSKPTEADRKPPTISGEDLIQRLGDPRRVATEPPPFSSDPASADHRS